MGKLNRYLLKNALISISGLIVFACVVLLLERLLRIFEVVSKSNNAASDATQMIGNLLPYYLGMAVPLALILGVLITVDRFSRSSELTAALGAGVSLFSMTRPFVLIAVFLTVITLILEGYMQPIGRYNYRAVEHNVKQGGATSVLSEGTFTTVGKTTFFADANPGDNMIGPVFIYENLNTGSQRLTTASVGRIIEREGTGEPVLQLGAGQTYRVTQDRSLKGQLDFQSSSAASALTENPFRARGNDELEMTTFELISNRKGDKEDALSRDVNNAALHLRFARAVMLLILPFIAVPFGINYGRNPSSAGVFISVVLLLVIQKSLEFGQSLGASGRIAPWLGIWPIMGVMALFAFVLFRKSAVKMGQPPLTSLNFMFDTAIKSIRKKIYNIFHPKKEAERLI